MTIIRVEKRDRWTVIENAALQDERLSWGALGLLCYLLSKPDNWVINSRLLAKLGRGGRDQTRRYMREWEAAGYLTREVERGEQGRVCTVTVLRETPGPENQAPAPGPENPASVPPGPGKPGPGKPAPGESGPSINTVTSKHGPTRTVRGKKGRGAGARGAPPPPPPPDPAWLMLEAWNRECADMQKSPCRMTEQRAGKLRRRLADEFGGDVTAWAGFCRKIAASDFLAGRSKDWKASLDWALEPRNVVKVLEGNYDNDARANHLRVVGGGHRAEPPSDAAAAAAALARIRSRA